MEQLVEDLEPRVVAKIVKQMQRRSMDLIVDGLTPQVVENIVEEACRVVPQDREAHRAEEITSSDIEHSVRVPVLPVMEQLVDVARMLPHGRIQPPHRGGHPSAEDRGVILGGGADNLADTRTEAHGGADRARARSQIQDKKIAEAVQFKPQEPVQN